MVNDNNSLPPDLWRILWRERAFQWFRENRQYNDFNLDSCLNILRGNATKREAAFSAFWSVYLANEIPPVMNEERLGEIRRLFEAHPLQNYQVEDIKDLAFVKLHLAGILATCLINPKYPVCENPSLVTMLEKALEAFKFAEPPEVDIDDPCGWGKELFTQNILGFSLILVVGIIRTELSLIRDDQRRYEEALSLISEGAWEICATTIEHESGQLPSFMPYLPHSGRSFDIQEAIDIFEGIKQHCKDMKNWEDIRICCEVLRYLSFFNLYDPTMVVSPLITDGLGAAEYWGRAATFSEEQKRIVDSPFPIVTRDMMERAETKDRLKRDFFPDTWEEILEEAKNILVDAELEWMHNRPDKMAKEIRPMLELVLPSVFPFMQLRPKKWDDPRMDLTRMRDYIRTERPVQTSILAKGIDPQKLQKLLDDVIHTRTYFEKDVHRETSSEHKRQMREKAISLRRELLGIGCEGILPKMMEIKKAAQSNK